MEEWNSGLGKMKEKSKTMFNFLTHYSNIPLFQCSSIYSTIPLFQSPN